MHSLCRRCLLRGAARRARRRHRQRRCVDHSEGFLDRRWHLCQKPLQKTDNLLVLSMRPCTTGISVLIGMKSITCAISPTSRRDKVEVLATKGHAKGGVSFRARGPDSAQATGDRVGSAQWAVGNHRGARARDPFLYMYHPNQTRMPPPPPALNAPARRDTSAFYQTCNPLHTCSSKHIPSTRDSSQHTTQTSLTSQRQSPPPAGFDPCE